MNKVQIKLEEMVTEKAEELNSFGVPLFNEWLGNNDRLIERTKSLYYVFNQNNIRAAIHVMPISELDKRDLLWLLDAHRSFNDAVQAASGIDENDAEAALEAEYGNWVRTDVDDWKFKQHDKCDD